MLMFSKLARPVALAFALTTGMSSSGCSSQPAFHPHAPTVESQLVRVEFLEQDEELFMFQVHSRSREPMVIRRDEVFLVVGEERIPRNPGGLKRVYDLPPGGSHDVFVAYDVDRLEDLTEFSISFETAITLNGAPIAGPVLQFTRATE